DLMCNKRVSFSETASSCNVHADTLRQAVRIDEIQLRELEADGLITYTGDEVRVTDTGSFFIRNVAASLDKDYREAVQTYSKTV
ncbi:MAG: coproporphyrinogen III oxidase, partial [Bacteroidales bacterium]